MIELFSLGKLYVSDFLKPEETPRSEKVEMKLMLTEEGAVRLEKSAPLDQMYGKYWYRSGINSTMKNELSSIVTSILSVMNMQSRDIWLDIACNDGTLLSFVPKELVRIGVDPADDSYKAESEKHANFIIQAFFNADDFLKKTNNNKAKVITSIAMFYDLEEPDNFIKDIDRVLDDNGLWVMQLSYTPLMLKQVAFDNICHEHIFYYSLFNLSNLLDKHNFKIVDCQLNDINGGSFRVYIMKKNANHKKFGTQPYRDICDFRLDSLIHYEKSLKLDSVTTWTNFYEQIENLKERTVSFIESEKRKGKTVWGYGASTKGNTLLQYFGIDFTLLDGIAERFPMKWGLRTVGTNIPIYSEEDMRKAQPDYLLILPWHFINEFTERESEFLKNGGKFIVPCPTFDIIGAK